MVTELPTETGAEVRLKTRMRLWWPWDLWPLASVAACVVLLVLNVTAFMWRWPYQDWMATSSAFMQQLQIVGPVVAAASAYCASRVAPASRVFARHPGGRPPAMVLARHLAVLHLWYGGAYVAALLPLVALSVRDARSGHLDYAVALAGLAGLSIFMLLGYAAGAVVGGIIAVPIAFAVALAIVMVGTTGQSPLSPVPVFPFAIGDVPATPLLAVRFVVLLLTAIAALAWAASVLGGSRRPPLITVSAALLVALFVVVVAHDPPQVRVSDPRAPARCDDTGIAVVCVHAGHAPQLLEVERAASLVLQAYGGSSSAPWHVTDAALKGIRTDAGSPSTLWVDMAPAYRDETDMAAQEIADQIIPIDVCALRHGFQLPPDVNDLYTYLQSWLTGGGAPPRGYTYPHFTGFSVAQMQAWMHEHDAELRSCTLSLAGLPD